MALELDNYDMTPVPEALPAKEQLREFSRKRKTAIGPSAGWLIET